MTAILAWLQSNWVQIGVILVMVDQVLISIFPSVPFLGSLKGILQNIFGAPPPASLK